jgi:hypothetical protein
MGRTGRRHDHDAGGDPELLVAKAALREEVWEALAGAGVVRFPGARNRISDFTGAEAAARRLRDGLPLDVSNPRPMPCSRPNGALQSLPRCWPGYPNASVVLVPTGRWTSVSYTVRDFSPAWVLALPWGPVITPNL